MRAALPLLLRRGLVHLLGWGLGRCPLDAHTGAGTRPGEATVEGVEGSSCLTVLEELDEATPLHMAWQQQQQHKQQIVFVALCCMPVACLRMPGTALPLHALGLLLRPQAWAHVVCAML